MGVNNSQAAASLAPNAPMVLAEVASSAPTSRPWRETQASCLLALTGLVGCVKQRERRRGEAETEGVNGVRETSDGGKAGPKPQSSSSNSSMIEATALETKYGFSCFNLKILWEIEYLFWNLCI